MNGQLGAIPDPFGLGQESYLIARGKELAAHYRSGESPSLRKESLNIAIVGGGLAGLGVCWHLCKHPNLRPTIFDPLGIAGGASGISTGLLHPFAGRRALRSWHSEEGMRETLALIAASEHASGRLVKEATGIFRPAMNDSQKRDFSLRANEDGDAVWLASSPYGEGLWIPGGITLYSRLYLAGLWKACESLGAEMVKESVTSLDTLESFNAVVLATGFETLKFAPHLPLKATKGQTLLCKWSERLPFSLVSQGHITPTEDPNICQIGSTYEHDYLSTDPDERVIGALLEKAAKFYPPAKDFEVLEVRAGVRIARPLGYRPVVEKIDPKTWVFTGLGSRGMLYHALFGKQIAEDIANTV